MPCVRQVLVAVDVCEQEGYVAESDFYGLGFELRAVFELIDQLLLFLCEVAGKENFGVECAEERAELGS